MKEKPDKGGGLGPVLIVAPLAVLCCLGPVVVAYGVGSGFLVSLLGWLAGIGAVVYAGLGVAAVVGIAYLVRRRRPPADPGLVPRDVGPISTKRRARL